MIRLAQITGQISILSLALFLPQLSHAQQQMYGLFMIVKGDVTYQNPNAKPEKAKVGAKVFEGATIKSEKESRAKIVMADRNVFNISPESKLTIQKYDATPGKKTVSLVLEEGKVRVNVEQKYDGNKEKFLLKTPTVVAGVRGTQFLGSYASATKSSQITTFQGTVAMTSFNSSGQPLGTVKVEKGQSSTANLNQAPEAPKFVPKQELKDLEKSTASTGAESKSSGGGTSGASTEAKAEVKMGGGGTQETSVDVAKEIKVSAGDKAVNSTPILVVTPLPGPPPQPKPPVFVPVLPTNTKVTITVQ